MSEIGTGAAVQVFRIADEGYSYELLNWMAPGTQMLNFIKKEKDEATSELKMVQPGTTNETVILVLINRLEALDKMMPSSFNKLAIAHLQDALGQLNLRTAERVNRGVEGKHVE